MNAQNNREDRPGTEAESSDTSALRADQPARVAPQPDGWPADEHPIFIDSGFRHVTPSAPVIDGLGERRGLTPGARLGSDATAEQFAGTWADVLDEKPTRADRWEYSVEEPQAEEDPHVTGALPLEEALERVRLTSGARPAAARGRALGDRADTVPESREARLGRARA